MNQRSLNVSPILRTKRFSDNMPATEGLTLMYCPVMFNTLFRWNRYNGSPKPALIPYSDGPSYCGSFR